VIGRPWTRLYSGELQHKLQPRERYLPPLLLLLPAAPSPLGGVGEGQT